MNYTYRKVILEDVLQLSLLLKQVYINTYSTEGITKEFAAFIHKQFSLEQVEADIKDPKKSIWIACNQGHPVGILQLEYEKQCPTKELVAAEVNKLYILPFYARQGIGAALMQLAEDELRNRKEKQCWLWVLEMNRKAVRFYEKLGYQDIGRAYLTLEDSYKNIIMLKEFP